MQLEDRSLNETADLLSVTLSAAKARTCSSLAGVIKLDKAAAEIGKNVTAVRGDV